MSPLRNVQQLNAAPLRLGDSFVEWLHYPARRRRTASALGNSRKPEHLGKPGMQIVILIPLGVRTGGPEAMHQLSDSLLGQGWDARVWYTQAGDLEALAGAVSEASGGNVTLRVPVRRNPFDDYDRYRVVPADVVHVDARTCFILPEVHINWIKHLPHSRCVIWWLSVDNALEGLGSRHVNLNTLRHSRVLHAWQSGYARDFLQALGMPQVLPLSDYTPPADIARGLARTDIAMNAGGKVIYDVAAIAARLERECGVRVHLIRGMSREQVYDALGRSKLFIDLGNFPGKDRMAREALLRGCCVFALDAGAARDYMLPDEFYFKPDDVEQIFPAAGLVMADQPRLFALQRAACEAVMRERFVFEREVGRLAQAVGCVRRAPEPAAAAAPDVAENSFASARVATEQEPTPA